MDENTISYKLNRINTAVERMKTKTGTTGQIIEDVASAVEELSMINNQDKTITNNGTYSADSGFTGLGTVTVNIIPNVMEKDITSNGEFVSQNDGVDGYNIVRVNVEPLLGTKTVTTNGTYNAGDDMVQGYSSFTVNVPTGGGSTIKSNIYRVTSIAERDAITDMVEGDICVVYEANINNATADSRFQTAIFPEVVVLDTAVTDSINISYRSVDESVMFDCWGMIDSSMFDMGCYSESGEINIRYTSTDGITYTRTDTMGNPVDFGTEIYYRMPENWNDSIGYFIQTGSIDFDGIFQYKDNNWDYVNIDISTTADYIYKNCKSYTNNGTVIGTLCLNPSSNLDDMNAKIYSELSMLYNGLDEIIAPEDSSRLYEETNIYTIPSKINGEPLLNTSNVTKMDFIFTNCKNLVSIPKLDTSKVTSMYNMFRNCTSLITIPQLDISSATNVTCMLMGCTSLASIPLLDTSNLTDMSHMFDGCSSLTTIPLLDISKVTTMDNTFFDCSSLITIPQLNTSNVKRLSHTFMYCRSLTSIPQLDASGIINMESIFEGCPNITTLGGFTNLGQAYLTTQSANYWAYSLNLADSTNITHDSLMNVINNLYNIASKGCNTQRLYLGSTNLAKLTNEEIAIATNKGWTVS